MQVDIKLDPGAKMPLYGSANAAGMDLYALADTWIDPGERVLISTGVHMAIPMGFYGRVAPRSGLALKNGIDVLAGVVDSDFRGDIAAILINLGEGRFVINAGDRIAQILICPVSQVDLNPVDELCGTKRGSNGYGSSGIR
jgi:dUTP pyrophosphatase